MAKRAVSDLISDLADAWDVSVTGKGNVMGLGDSTGSGYMTMVYWRNGGEANYIAPRPPLDYRRFLPWVVVGPGDGHAPPVAGKFRIQIGLAYAQYFSVSQNKWVEFSGVPNNSFSMDWWPNAATAYSISPVATGGSGQLIFTDDPSSGGAHWVYHNNILFQDIAGADGEMAAIHVRIEVTLVANGSGVLDLTGVEIWAQPGSDCYGLDGGGSPYTGDYDRALGGGRVMRISSTPTEFNYVHVKDTAGRLRIYTPKDPALISLIKTQAWLEANPPIGYTVSGSPTPAPPPPPPPPPAVAPAAIGRWWAPKHAWLAKAAPAVPVMATTFLVSATAGLAGSQTVTATGDGSITYSASGLPLGATLSSGGTLSWDTTLVPATYPVTITPTSSTTGPGTPVVYSWTVLPAGTLNDPGAWAPHLRRRLA